MSKDTLPIKIGGATKFIISTSGRVSSLKRYQKLLQEVLEVDIAYIPISSGSSIDAAIDPQRFAWTLKGMNCVGGAISKDIKHSIIPFLDEIDESAKAVQSVNTVIYKNARLIGYNTDAFGFQAAITHGMRQHQFSIKKAVCYGYGGVASVVVYVLLSLGIEVFIAGRRLEIAQERAHELNAVAWSRDNKDTIDLFINATPASEAPLELAANFLDALQPCTLVFDHEMPGKYLLEYCQAHNKAHISGYDMYYPQMYAQWQLFLQDFVETEKIPELIKQAEALCSP